MNPNLQIGDPIIDRQHAELFQLFQKLIASGRTEESVSEIFSTLTEQVFKHFQTEERLMSRLGLPSKMLEEHQLAHQEIIEELTNIHLDTLHGLGFSVEQTIQKVAVCVNQHLVDFDLGLRPFIQAAI